MLEESQLGIMSSVFGQLSVEMRPMHDQTAGMQAVFLGGFQFGHNR